MLLVELSPSGRSHLDSHVAKVAHSPFKVGVGVKVLLAIPGVVGPYALGIVAGDNHCVLVGHQGHHLTRDLAYRERVRPVYEAGTELGVTVECAAEFLNQKPNLLEARRRELYETGRGS